MLISWAIDGILAVSLLTAVYTGGQFVERLDGVILTMENLSNRVGKLETSDITPEANRRISMLEVQSAAQERTALEFRTELYTRLNRLEDKLDKALK